MNTSNLFTFQFSKTQLFNNTYSKFLSKDDKNAKKEDEIKREIVEIKFKEDNLVKNSKVLDKDKESKRAKIILSYDNDREIIKK